MSQPTSSSSRRRRRDRRRGSRRAESHRQAQADAGPPTRIPDHPLVPQGAPEVVTTDDALADLLAHARESGRVAYDTEFIGEETYVPRICLIQLATAERIAVVDPFTEIDLEPIWALVADPDVETIVHAGQQDLEPVVRLLGRPPARVFDTQVAAAFVNLPYPLGLHRIVEAFLGIRLGKGQTFTNWASRPLSKVQIRYAADDVRFLVAVHEAISTRLDELGHAGRVEAACADLADPARYRFDVDSTCARLVGTRSLPRRAIAMLHRLVAFRDEAARARNVPPRTFLQDEVLVRLAKQPPRAIDAMHGVKGLPRPVIAEFGARIVEIAEEVRGLEPAALPARTVPEETPEERVRVDGLWALVGALCHGRSVNPSIVANRGDVARLYFAARDGDDGEGGRLLEGWRRALVGDLVLEVLGGSATVELRWAGDRLHASATSENDGAAPTGG